MLVTMNEMDLPCVAKLFTKQQNLDLTKLKAFANNKLNVAKMTISLIDSVENIVGKRENAGYQHFLFFPQSFPKPSSVGSLKVRIVWYRVKVFKISQNIS